MAEFHDYDRVAYPSLAHPESFAEALSIKGFLRGLDVARPDACRVLELGCGDGFNLAAMAVRHPGAHYTGIDYSAEAVTRGRRMLDERGLRQVRLETTDIRALDNGDTLPGSFDYVIAHGVYSWVPADVRDALLSTIGRVLAPHGVAFVSYLVLPGAHMREMARTIMRFHTRAEADPHVKVEQAASVLRFVARSTQDDGAYSRSIASELALIEARAEELVFHDELSSVSAPLLFTEFLNHAAGHGLHFLAEAEHLLPVSPGLSDEARETLRPLEANRILLEQYMDFAEGRRFRQTLLCRPGLGATIDVQRLDSLSVTFNGILRTSPPENPADAGSLEFDGLQGSTLRTRRPFEKAVLLSLTDRQGAVIPFPTLLAAVRARMAGDVAPMDLESDVRDYLIHAYLPGLIEFSWS